MFAIVFLLIMAGAGLTLFVVVLTLLDAAFDLWIPWRADGQRTQSSRKRRSSSERRLATDNSDRDVRFTQHKPGSGFAIPPKSREKCRLCSATRLP